MTPTERLLHLADALEFNAGDPSGMQFDLNFWAGPSDTVMDSTSPAWDEDWRNFEHRGRNCGTTGCAVGLAMLLPEFQAEGLRVTFIATYEAFAPMFADAIGFPAIERFFSLSQEEAYRLFHYRAYPERKGALAEREVARRIRVLVAEKQAGTQ